MPSQSRGFSRPIKPPRLDGATDPQEPQGPQGPQNPSDNIDFKSDQELRLIAKHVLLTHGAALALLGLVQFSGHSIWPSCVYSVFMSSLSFACSLLGPRKWFRWCMGRDQGWYPILVGGRLYILVELLVYFYHFLEEHKPKNLL